MKFCKLIALILVLIGTSQLWALDFSATLNQTNVDTSTSNTAAAGTTSAADASANKGLATLAAGTTGYVRVNTSLNVRDAVWGNIIGSLKNNDAVNITGKEGDWYKISYNGKTAYVHSKYVSSAKGTGSVATASNANTGAGSTPALNVSGSGSAALRSNARVVQEANNLVSKYSSPGSFPYDAATKNGSLGCAQVVTTALKAAGVKIGIDLSCLSTKSKLLKQGYKQVSVPPYQAGDIIFWSTYDRDKDGKKDADTHIGIAVTSGNSAQAMSNSSSQKKPRIHAANYSPVTTVLRLA